MRKKLIFTSYRKCNGFTLIELLVVIAIIAVLAAILFPVFSQAKQAAKQSACLSNMRQIGIGINLYLSDSDDLYPDRRDLKLSLGYRPWTSWPPSDPRSGWAREIFQPYLKNSDLFSCPNLVTSDYGNSPQVLQNLSRYWMWRFDRAGATIELDNFWGKSTEQIIDDLNRANNPQVGRVSGAAEVELIVDPYFPSTIPTVLASQRGKTPHAGGRNRLFLDLHAKWLRDIRTNP